MKCHICGEEGKLSQAPYPIPISNCYCNICYELEGIAYDVWATLYPQESKYNAPVPIMKTIEDKPPDCLSLTLEEVKEFFVKKLER